MTTAAFREDIRSALHRGASPAELRAIAVRHRAGGLSQRDAYDMLDTLRTELQCGADDENSVCESLEGLMDRVWGFCPRADQIWESSLSETEKT